MKQAIIIHGKPSREEYFGSEGMSQSRKHWLGWLGDELAALGYATHNLEMPEPYEPVYEKWKTVFEQYPIDQDTVLVGHSCGGGFLLRWLSENKVKAGTVALVAPWIDPTRKLTTGFFEFQIDQNILEKVKKLIVFVSSDDEPPILESVSQITRELKDVELKEFSNRGHFTYGDMGTHEFPELLEAITRESLI